MTTLPHRAAPAAFGLLIAAKLVFFLAFGPVHFPDTAGYAEYASRILASRDWLTHIDMQAETDPILAFRMAGYPGLLALTQALFGRFGESAVVLAQMALSLFVTFRFHRLLRAIALPAWLALAGAACQATSLQFTLDQCLLTDSLYLSLITLVTVRIIESGQQGDSSVRGYLGTGLLLLLAFLLRDATAAVAILMVPAAFFAARGSNRSALSGALVAGALFLPLAAGIVSYRAWNEHRSGTAFVTTVAHTTELYALVEAQQIDARVFAGDTQLDQIARANLKDYDYPTTVAIADAWHQASGIDAIEATKVVSARFWQTWRNYPWTMTRATLARFRGTYLLLPFRPFESVDDLFVANADEGPHVISAPALWLALKAGRVWAAAPLLSEFATQALSLAISIAFLLYPVFGRRLSLPATVHLTLLGFWFFVLAFTAAYMMIHLDPRYMGPLLPIVTMLGLLVLRPLIERNFGRPGSR